MLRFRTSILLGFAATWWLSAFAVGQEPLVTTLFAKGVGESQLLDISANGIAVGRCEVFDVVGNAKTVLNVTFSTDRISILPVHAGFRHLDLHAISDRHLVVGHTYGPLQSGGKSLQAIAIDVSSGEVIELPQINGSQNSIATAISANGETIAGLCSGQPCIWRRVGDQWRVSTISEEDCVSTRVLLSPNGAIAACAARHQQENVLLVWQQADVGWTVVKRVKANLSPYDVNDQGVAVGAMSIVVGGGNQTRGFVLGQTNTPLEIAPLADDNFSIARGINNFGVVVGWSDCVGEPEKHPRAIRYGSGTTSEIVIADSIGSQAYAINDRGDIVGLLSRLDDPHSVGFVLRFVDSKP